jgi:beta-galactosidase
MAKVTYDGRSLQIDGRRQWTMWGDMPYAYIPADAWRDRIRAAKQAGLNGISSPVFWNLHEPEPEQFDFEGRLNLKHFVEIVGEEGMFCWLRPGPYVGGVQSNGGLPPWLHGVKTDRKSGPMLMRWASPPFLGAVSRYFGKVMEQVAGLQATSPDGGPLLMMQIEQNWFAHHEQQAEGYHRQLVRFLQENGCDVPITAANQLWQIVDGTIHTWQGSANLLADLRQLGQIQPDVPKFISRFVIKQPQSALQVDHQAMSPEEILIRLSGVLAAGGQACIAPFAGGTLSGGEAGLLADGPAGHFAYPKAPLDALGKRQASYFAIKKCATFATQFGQTFANLHADAGPAVIHPQGDGHPPSVIHLTGDRGEVIFVIKPPRDNKTKQINLLLGNGLSLPVHLDGDPVAWLGLDLPIGQAVLDYTNLRPWALIAEKLLILFGPPGSQGLLSINGLPAQVAVPKKGQPPLITAIDGLQVVVINNQQIDSAYPTEDSLWLDVAGLDDEGQPLPLKPHSKATRIAANGDLSSVAISSPRRPPAPKLSDWSSCDAYSLLKNKAEEWTSLKVPTPLDLLDPSANRGWYRLQLPRSSKAKAADMLLAIGGDQFQIFRDGKYEATLRENGQPAKIKPAGDIIMLAHIIGRSSDGQSVGELKGVSSDLFHVEPVKLAKPVIENISTPDPYELKHFVFEQRADDPKPSQSYSWPAKPAGRQPMLLDLVKFPVPALVRCNDKTIAYWHPSLSHGRLPITLDPQSESTFTTGQNRIEIVPLAPVPEKFEVLKHIQLWQTKANVSAKAKWSFMPFRLPNLEENLGDTASGSGPAWHQTQFNARSSDLDLLVAFEFDGDAELWVNDRSVGRIHASHVTNHRILIPRDILEVGENKLMLFTDVGDRPKKFKLTYQ